VDPDGPQAGQPLQHGLLVGGDHALGDLRHQVARVEPGGAQGAGHVLEQVGLLELADRQVDAQERRPGEREAALPVPGLQAAPQPLGHHPQDLVARGVAEAVVDRLEVVQVEQEQGRGGPGRRKLGQGLAEAPGERDPVVEPGQGVDAGPPDQLGGQLGPVEGQGDGGPAVPCGAAAGRAVGL
jgi:hypothetical protein